MGPGAENTVPRSGHLQRKRKMFVLIWTMSVKCQLKNSADLFLT